LPDGVGFTQLRIVNSFGGNDITRALTLLATHAPIGIALLVTFAERLRPMNFGDEPEAQLTAAAAAGISQRDGTAS